MSDQTKKPEDQQIAPHTTPEQRNVRAVLDPETKRNAARSILTALSAAMPAKARAELRRRAADQETADAIDDGAIASAMATQAAGRPLSILQQGQLHGVLAEKLVRALAKRFGIKKPDPGLVSKAAQALLTGRMPADGKD